MFNPLLSTSHSQFAAYPLSLTPYLTNPRYKSYVSAFDDALLSFESVRDWSDLILALQKIRTVLDNKRYSEFPLIPPSLTAAITKRLAQCLNPGLPSGVHLKALEIYQLVLLRIGPDMLSYDLSLYSTGLFPLFANGSTKVRPVLLDIFEHFYLPLGINLSPCLSGFILAIIPGIEDETSESYEHCLSLLDSVKSCIPLNEFMLCVWRVLLLSASARLATLNYLSIILPKQSAALTPYLSTPPSIFVSAVQSAIVTPSILAQRKALEILLIYFPLSTSLNTIVSPENMELLLVSSLNVLLQNELSLSRRVFQWLNVAREDTKSRKNSSDDVESDDSVPSEQNPPISSSPVDNFVIQCLLNMLDNAITQASRIIARDVTTRSPVYRIDPNNAIDQGNSSNESGNDSNALSSSAKDGDEIIKPIQILCILVEKPELIPILRKLNPKLLQFIFHSHQKLNSSQLHIVREYYSKLLPLDLWNCIYQLLVTAHESLQASAVSDQPQSEDNHISTLRQTVNQVNLAIFAIEFFLSDQLLASKTKPTADAGVDLEIMHNIVQLLFEITVQFLASRALEMSSLTISTIKDLLPFVGNKIAEEKVCLQLGTTFQLIMSSIQSFIEANIATTECIHLANKFCCIFEDLFVDSFASNSDSTVGVSNFVSKLYPFTQSSSYDFALLPISLWVSMATRFQLEGLQDQYQSILLALWSMLDGKFSHTHYLLAELFSRLQHRDAAIVENFIHRQFEMNTLPTYAHELNYLKLSRLWLLSNSSKNDHLNSPIMSSSILWLLLDALVPITAGSIQSSPSPSRLAVASRIWLRESISNASRLLDHFFVVLLHPSTVRTSRPYYTYRQSFDMSRVAYLIEKLSVIIDQAPRLFLQQCMSTSVKQSTLELYFQHPLQIESASPHKEDSQLFDYFLLLCETLVLYVQGTPNAKFSADEFEFCDRIRCLSISCLRTILMNSPSSARTQALSSRLIEPMLLTLASNSGFAHSPKISNSSTASYFSVNEERFHDYWESSIFEMWNISSINIPPNDKLVEFQLPPRFLEVYKPNMVVRQSLLPLCKILIMELQHTLIEPMVFSTPFFASVILSIVHNQISLNWESEGNKNSSTNSDAAQAQTPSEISSLSHCVGFSIEILPHLRSAAPSFMHALLSVLLLNLKKLSLACYEKTTTLNNFGISSSQFQDISVLFRGIKSIIHHCLHHLPPQTLSELSLTESIFISPESTSSGLLSSVTNLFIPSSTKTLPQIQPVDQNQITLNALFHLYAHLVEVLCRLRTVLSTMLYNNQERPSSNSSLPYQFSSVLKLASSNSPSSTCREALQKLLNQSTSLFEVIYSKTPARFILAIITNWYRERTPPKPVSSHQAANINAFQNEIICLLNSFTNGTPKSILYLVVPLAVTILTAVRSTKRPKKVGEIVVNSISPLKTEEIAVLHFLDAYMCECAFQSSLPTAWPAVNHLCKECLSSCDHPMVLLWLLGVLHTFLSRCSVEKFDPKNRKEIQSLVQHITGIIAIVSAESLELTVDCGVGSEVPFSMQIPPALTYLSSTSDEEDLVPPLPPWLSSASVEVISPSSTYTVSLHDSNHVYKIRSSSVPFEHPILPASISDLAITDRRHFSAADTASNDLALQKDVTRSLSSPSLANKLYFKPPLEDFRTADARELDSIVRSESRSASGVTTPTSSRIRATSTSVDPAAELSVSRRRSTDFSAPFHSTKPFSSLIGSHIIRVSLVALQCLSNVLASLLDLCYSVPEERDRAAILLSAILPSLFSALRNHRPSHFAFATSAATLLATLSISKRVYTMKYWKTQAWDHFMSEHFFVSDIVALEQFRWVIARVCSDDKLALLPLIGKSSTQPYNIFTSRDNEIKERAQTMKRLAFILHSGRIDQYSRHLPAIVERMIECLKINNTPRASILHAEVILCMRILLARVSPEHLSSVWPHVLMELIRVLRDSRGSGAVGSDWLLLLSAMKFIDVAMVLMPAQFLLYQWMFLVDTLQETVRSMNGTSGSAGPKTTNKTEQLLSVPKPPNSSNPDPSPASSPLLTTPHLTSSASMPAPLTGSKSDEIKSNSFVKDYQLPLVFLPHLHALAQELPHLTEPSTYPYPNITKRRPVLLMPSVEQLADLSNAHSLLVSASIHLSTAHQEQPDLEFIDQLLLTDLVERP